MTQASQIIETHAELRSMDDVAELLVSGWYEVRLCGFLILTYKMERLSTKKMAGNIEAIRERDRIVKLYLEYADHANNWDLVDLSAEDRRHYYMQMKSNGRPNPERT